MLPFVSGIMVDCHNRKTDNITLDFVSGDIGFLSVVIYHNTLNKRQYVYSIVVLNDSVRVDVYSLLE